MKSEVQKLMTEILKSETTTSLAARMGVNYFTVLRWRDGKTKPRPAEAEKLARIAEEGRRPVEEIIQERRNDILGRGEGA